MRAVFLDYATVSNSDLDTAGLRRVLPGLVFHATTDAGQLGERLKDAECVLLNKVRLTREILESAPRLRLVALAATGTDHIDLNAAAARGIGVCNVRAYCTPAVVQHAWAMILSLTQRLATYGELARDGAWREDGPPMIHAAAIRELAGRTLGIVGWGELGRGVAGVAAAFRMRVLVAARAGTVPADGRLALNDVLRAADIVSLHCPLTAATRGMIGAAELALMKPDALLINTARGALVDTAALAAALKAGRLGGAGVDVLPQEPPPANEPLLDPSVPNLLLTPHIAWAARDARQRCLDQMAANIEDFRRGGRAGRVV
jgi:glycerate dehydrogenase